MNSDPGRTGADRGSRPTDDLDSIEHLVNSSNVEVDADAEEAWLVEIERRIGGIQAGDVVGVPAEEVFAAMRTKYRAS